MAFLWWLAFIVCVVGSFGLFVFVCFLIHEAIKALSIFVFVRFSFPDAGFRWAHVLLQLSVSSVLIGAAIWLFLIWEGHGIVNFLLIEFIVALIAVFIRYVKTVSSDSIDLMMRKTEYANSIDLMIKNKEYANALVELDNLLKGNQGDSRDFIFAIVCCFQTNNHGKMIEIFEQYEKKWPIKQSGLYSLIGRAYFELQQNEKGKSCLMTMLKDKKTDWSGLIYAAELFTGAELLPEAIGVYTDMLLLEPDNHYVHSNIAGLKLRLGEPDAALAHIERVMELDSSYSIGYSDFGRYLMTKGQYDKALSQFVLAQYKQPQIPELQDYINEVRQKISGE